MALNAKKAGGGKQFTKQPNIDAGVYPGRLVQVIDLGLQAQKEFKGKAKPPVQELYLTYELVDEFMKDEEGNDIEDKPRWVSERLPFYGLFADKAKSTQRFLAFDPKDDFDGDWAKCLGMAINVAIVNNTVGDITYDNIAAISTMRPRDAQQCPELKNESKLFDLDAPDMETFNKLPAWLQDVIKGNLNYAGSVLEEALKGDKPKAEKPAKKDRSAPKPEADEDNPETGSDNPY